MTLERLTALQSDPRIAPYLHAAPLSAQTALTLYHAGRLGLLTPAEADLYSDLPRPWIEGCRSSVSGFSDTDLLALSPQNIAVAVAATHGAPERWREVLPLVVRRQDILAADGMSDMVADV